MARSEIVYLQGKTKWFRATTPNPWGKWAHVLYLTGDDLDKVRDLTTGTEDKPAIKNQLRKDDDGYFITLSRPTSKSFKGKVQGFAPPEVVQADGKTPFKGDVGNGSDITTKIVVYPYTVPGTKSQKGRAIRWESSRIDNLVPWEGDRDYEGYDAKRVKGLADQPAQDEEIPF